MLESVAGHCALWVSSQRFATFVSRALKLYLSLYKVSHEHSAQNAINLPILFTIQELKLLYGNLLKSK